MTTLVLRGARLADGTGEEPVAEAVVVVEDGRISQVGGKAPTGKHVTELDLAGHTIVPGLIDAHAHLTLVSMDEAVATAVLAARIFRVCSIALDAGFTTVRDAGGADGGLANAVKQGLVRGPHIYPSGPALCQTGGHGETRAPWIHTHGDAWGLPGLFTFSQVVDGPDEVRKAAREAFWRGATQIKVCTSGGVVSFTDRLEDTQLTVEELRAAVEEAAARDTYVMAHSHNVAGIRNGLEAGVHSFEHATFLDHDTAHLIAEAGAYVVPTLAVVHLLADEWREWGLPEIAATRVQGIEAAMSKAVQIAAESGVKLGSGSDLLGPEQNRRGLELLLRSRLSSPMAALVSATRTNAELMRIDDRVGTIAEHKRADIAVFEGNPLEDPELFDTPDKVAVVIQGGDIVKDLR